LKKFFKKKLWGGGGEVSMLGQSSYAYTVCSSIR